MPSTELEIKFANLIVETIQKMQKQIDRQENHILTLVTHVENLYKIVAHLTGEENKDAKTLDKDFKGIVQ